jgi:hypothetical protein
MIDFLSRTSFASSSLWAMRGIFDKNDETKGTVFPFIKPDLRQKLDIPGLFLVYRNLKESAMLVDEPKPGWKIQEEPLSPY